MEFANKEYLLLGLLVIPYVLWYFLARRRNEPTMRVSDATVYEGVNRGWKTRLTHVPMLLRCLTWVLIVIVMARPQTHSSWDNRTTEGIDIMLALDLSTSMLAEDLRPNRMEAAKNVAAKFISNRPNDNIGLTIFAGEAFTQCPMTTDHATLLNLLHAVRTDWSANGVISDGTAIGMGIANAVSRLKDAKEKSKVIILLTDGVNNCGEISPATAAQMAKALGIRIYTVGLGTNDVAPYPIPVAGGVQYVNMPTEIDEDMLRSIAKTADGRYYRATNNKELSAIYDDIDRLEKTKMSVQTFSKRYEAFAPWALAALVVLLMEILLRSVILRRVP